VISGYFNNDTQLDLAVTNRFDNTVGLLLGNGDGTFMDQTNYTVGSNPTSLISGDFNGNGKMDLAVIDTLSNDISVLLNECGKNNN
jgi:hypothetical protein